MNWSALKSAFYYFSMPHNYLLNGTLLLLSTQIQLLKGIATFEDTYIL